MNTTSTYYKISTENAKQVSLATVPLLVLNSACLQTSDKSNIRRAFRYFLLNRYILNEIE